MVQTSFGLCVGVFTGSCLCQDVLRLNSTPAERSSHVVCCVHMDSDRAPCLPSSCLLLRCAVVNLSPCLLLRCNPGPLRHSEVRPLQLQPFLLLILLVSVGGSGEPQRGGHLLRRERQETSLLRHLEERVWRGPGGQTGLLAGRRQLLRQVSGSSETGESLMAETGQLVSDLHTVCSHSLSFSQSN